MLESIIEIHKSIVCRINELKQLDNKEMTIEYLERALSNVSKAIIELKEV